MSNFIDWAISKAQHVTEGDPIEYEGKVYKSITRRFNGNLNPGRVKALRKEFGTSPVNEEYRQVTCKWGGNYISEMSRVMVIETIYFEA